MKSNRFVVNAPGVVSETIDGETVIMNLDSGNYYSVDRCGALVWSLLSQRQTVGEVIERVQTLTTDGLEQVEPTIFSFVSELLEHKLIRSLNESDPVDQDLQLEAVDWSGSFQPFELNVYTNLQDLLLLDPIHDVDQSGWPQPKSTT